MQLTRDSIYNSYKLLPNLYYSLGVAYKMATSLLIKLQWYQILSLKERDTIPSSGVNSKKKSTADFYHSLCLWLVQGAQWCMGNVMGAPQKDSLVLKALHQQIFQQFFSVSGCDVCVAAAQGQREERAKWQKRNIEHDRSERWKEPGS